MELYLIVFIALSISLGCRSEERTSDISSLPVPQLINLRIEEPPHIVVKWKPINISIDNPILGFKVKLWEDEKKKEIKHVDKDGKQELVEELVPNERYFETSASDESWSEPLPTLHTHEPAFIAVVPPDVFSASFDVEFDKHYEIRAQSFNALGDGKLSNSYGFKVHPKEEDLKSPKSES